MDEQIIQALIAINQTFYEQFGDAFAKTRQRIQPGVRNLLTSFASHGHWLDLGCGNGSVLSAWAEITKEGSYTGWISAKPCWQKQSRELNRSEVKGISVWINQADIGRAGWQNLLTEMQDRNPAIPLRYDGVMCFATIHHIPGISQRKAFMQTIHEVLKPGGKLLLSCWQFHNSPKLLNRVQPWSLTGIDPARLEDGDTLLDWRAALPGQEQKPGLRYVHLFSRDELERLAKESNFVIIQTFESDGEGGRLGLYQVWEAN